MATNYDGLTKNLWPGTWSPSSTQPIVLDSEIRGGLRSVTGLSGDRLSDISGQRLEIGMLVYVRDAYSESGASYTANTYYQYKLLTSQVRDPATGAMPNASGNWSIFVVNTGYTGTGTGGSGFGYTGSSGASVNRGYGGSFGYTGSIGYTGSRGVDGVGLQITGSVLYYGLLPNYPTGYTGSIGTAYIETSTGSLWIWLGTIWTNVGRILGYTGSAGFIGRDGYTGSGGSGGGGSGGGSPNLDGGIPSSNYGGITSFDAGGVV
jgi:hypothetical protein